MNLADHIKCRFKDVRINNLSDPPDRFEQLLESVCEPENDLIKNYAELPNFFVQYNEMKDWADFGNDSNGKLNIFEFMEAVDYTNRNSADDKELTDALLQLINLSLKYNMNLYVTEE